VEVVAQERVRERAASDRAEPDEQERGAFGWHASLQASDQESARIRRESDGSTRSVKPRSTIVVAVLSSTTAGPRTIMPGSRRSRSCNAAAWRRARLLARPL